MNADIGKTVEQILKNPDFAGIINELRGSTDSPAPNVSQEEILSHLPDVLSMLNPLIGGTSNDEPTPTPDPPEESTPASTTPVPIPVPKKYDKTRAEKLMSALKPYLNANRCDIIDKCVSVLQITDVMELLKGMEGIPKPKP